MALLLVTIPILLLIFSGKYNSKKSEKRTISPMRIAHRGAAGYCPENTLASYRKAVELGADLIEIDVQLSKDGKIVVIHDETVDRTTDGQGDVRNYMLKDLRKLDAGSWYDSGFTGERIPTLREVLDEILPQAGLMIEIKDPHLNKGIEEKLVEELKSRHIPSDQQIMVQSFDQHCIKRFHKLLPSIPAGVLFKYSPLGISSRKISEISGFASFINTKRTMMSPRLAARIKAAGLEAFTWTVNEPREIVKFTNMGLDGITTDYPDYF
ncbi:glycerophosphodiester phosphodiesterase [Peribacillus sp. SCS-155]|uniref:glycerophosphodiester phosphodiesterase n=1 Tax=Peribacillus sedimenti TaxID=3115297 RepID=UPI0039063E99